MMFEQWDRGLVSGSKIADRWSEYKTKGQLCRRSCWWGVVTGLCGEPSASTNAVRRLRMKSPRGSDRLRSALRHSLPAELIARSVLSVLSCLKRASALTFARRNNGFGRWTGGLARWPCAAVSALCCPGSGACAPDAGARVPQRPGMWRKLVGVEPTCDTMYRTPGLKPVPSTGQE